MNIRLKASLHTLGILASCIVASVAAVLLINTIPMAWLPWIGIGTLIAVAINVVYSVTLSQLHYEAKIKELVDQK